MVEGCTIQGAITVINLQYLKEKTAFIYRADGPHLSRGASQSRGIDQVGLAVAEMDRVTQQNASLVEESAAAAAALEEQASRLTQAVAVFRIQQQQQRAREVAAVKTPAAVSSPKAAVADGSDNWETF